MTNRITYATHPNKIVLLDNSVYESQTPFWVYYNGKTACKFDKRDDAKTYINALLSSYYSR